MYSENGRLKKSKQKDIAEKDVNLKHVLVCNNCGIKLVNMTKEFGETIECPRCGSDDVGYKLTTK